MDPGTAYLVKQFKAEIMNKGGNGYHALQRRFRIMDDAGNKRLSLAEFKKGVKDLSLTSLKDGEIRAMFDFFDNDNNGSIDFEEFIRGVRDSLNDRRLGMVKQAFSRLDLDNDGAATVDELKQIYDVSQHPHFIDGTKTKTQILTTFMESFEQGNNNEVGDGKITEQEFINYYENLSVTIDSDDYFELMIRNSWHISGGEGQAANSANTRVLVTNADGSQSVAEIHNDLGMKQGDNEDAMRRIKKQGNGNVSSISFGDSSDSTTQSKVSAAGAGTKQMLLQKYAADQEALEKRGRPQSPDRSPSHSAGRKTSGVDAFSSSIGSLLIEDKDPVQVAPPASGGSFTLHHANVDSKPSVNKTAVMPHGVKALVDAFKTELKSHGAHGFHGLQRKFRIMDDDGNNRLSLGEFKKGIKELSLIFTDSEIRQMFNYFDYLDQGEIDFNEFIIALRNPMNENRQSIVRMAFDSLDEDGDGTLEPSELMEKYDASQHPDVLTGRKSADQVLREWLTVFEVGGVEDGKVTLEEFENYYTNLSANIDRDDYFELMVRNAWHLSGGEGSAANSSNRRVLVTMDDGSQKVMEVENDLGVTDKAGLHARIKAQDAHAANINLFSGAGDLHQDLPPPPHAAPGGRKVVTSKYQAAHQASLSSIGSAAALAGLDPPVQAVKADVAPARKNPGVPLNILAASRCRGIPAILAEVKASLASRGARGIVGLSRKFKIMDDSGNGALSMSEFKKAMQECEISLSAAEISALFVFFDKDGSGDIDFEEFLQGIKGPLNDMRLELVKLAYTKLDKNGDGIVDPSEIMSLYNANSHPDVLSGKKTPQEVLREFLETFEVGGEIDGKVTFEEFCNYYSNLGVSIDSDEYFELMIRNSWRIMGGEGAAANSANKRVLATLADGSQQVVGLNNDVASANPDKPKTNTLSDLKKQGVDAVSFSTSSTAKAGDSGLALPPVPPMRARRGGVSNDSPFSTNSAWSHNVSPTNPPVVTSPQARRSFGHNNHKSSITF